MMLYHMVLAQQTEYSQYLVVVVAAAAAVAVVLQGGISVLPYNFHC
jgi:hypothetical protein